MLLKGMPIVNAKKSELQARSGALKGKGITPCLAIVRVGEREDDLSYERGAIKRCDMLGVACRVFAFPSDIESGEFQKEFQKINADDSIHGILVFRPLPKGLDGDAVAKTISPQKDVDGISPVNMAAVFAGTEGFAPCTAEAVMLMLEGSGMDVSGKRVVVVGRSLVVGKPLSMLMLQKNATVTVCHTKTADLAAECRRADILVAAAGKAGMITAEHVSPGAVVIDVGINPAPDGGICGDVDFEAVQPVAGSITPVPGGVGTLTTLVLARNVITAAERTL